MTTIPNRRIFIFWFLSLMVSSGAPSDDLQDALDKTGVTVRQPPPSHGELVMNPYYLADLKELPPDKKTILAAQLTHIIPRLVQERIAGPIPRWQDSLLGILLLQEIGSDEQKIEAFRNLDLYRDSLSDACVALATCEGSEGVRILNQYAELQFLDMELEISQSKSGTTPVRNADQVPPLKKFGDALMALQGAYHSEGPSAATALYDRFKKLFGDILSESELAKIERDMKEARHRRENYIREKRPSIKRDFNNGRVDGRQSGSVSDRSPVVISPKWFWPGISVGASLLFLTGWLLIRRKTSKP